MQPDNTDLTNLIDRLTASTHSHEVAYAHNCLFETRISKPRQAGYENDYAPTAPELGAWRERHRDYLCRQVYVRREGVPETFTTNNADALLGPLAEEQYLLRLENLDEALQGQQLTLSELTELWEDARHGSDPDRIEDAEAYLDEFCNHWNNAVRRQHRPVFATFADELEAEIESDHWSDLIRNRLGLSHYDIRDSAQAIPVALLRYRVSEVLANLGEEQQGHAFAVPTMLDSDLNAHFFPTPKAVQYGRTLDLETDPECVRLVSELLHYRFDYRPEHIYRLGEIRSPIPAYGRGPALAHLRNEHLFCLRLESGLNDFGTEIAENDHT